MTMKTQAFISRILAFGFGVVGALLLLEGVLRLLPVIEGTYAADPRESWPVHTMIPDSRYTYSKEWNLQNIHHGRINNYGYAAPFDYQSSREPGSGGVAVFGYVVVLEREIDGLGEFPVGEIHGGIAFVMQLDVFPQASHHGIVHDFVDDDGITQLKEVPLTAADFALREGRFKKHFQPVTQGQDLVPVPGQVRDQGGLGQGC